ncbi:ABC transporter ATP-binding protein/permease [Telmatospirillum siberiense]|uniref:ABC transporter ATP-binding protein n=1 Tax=Telmatospirillum siberiense TaxID=382514 RepID=A0A2N3PVB0_9PROT|nr:ABC transporter ATP-binding protein/permease [Telmatospirillum siberiense]PKU24335.1 hypothetical protein CWS72_12130 [Telmatospirillum siberiense]
MRRQSVPLPYSDGANLERLSLVPGRIRWRWRALRDTPGLPERLTEALNGCPGVLQVQVDSRIMRILVLFDRRTDVDALEAVISALWSSPETAPETVDWPDLTGRLIRAPEARLGTVLAGGAAVASLVRIFSLGRTLDRLLRGGALSGRVALAGPMGLSLAGILAGTFAYIELKRRSSNIWHRLGRTVETEMRLALSQRLLLADQPALDGQSTSSLANSIRHNLVQIEQGFDGLSALAHIALNTALLTLTFFVLAPQLVWIPLLALLAMVVEVRRSYRDMRQRYEIAGEARNLPDRKLTELIDGLTTIRGYGLEERVLADMRQAATAYERISIEASRQSVRYPLRLELITLLGVSAVTLAAGLALAAGTISPGSHLVLMLISGHLFYPFSNLGQALDSVNHGLAAYRSLSRISALPIERDDGSTALAPDAPADAIEFSNVVFGYPGARELAIRNIDLRIPRGSVVGIVGASGSGKSTLVKLLLRFYDPLEGSVRIDGEDIRNFRRESLRKVFSCVDQRSFLFEDTVGHNIGLGQEDADAESIVEAARSAHIHHFVEALPQGYFTEIGVQGLKLSDGQRQRLLIARALLKRSPVLLLDEATSNLDAVTEQSVLSGIRQRMAGHTIIVVAHRLAAVRDADTIIVLDHGRIVETGSHAGLIRKNGFYRSLLNSQNRGVSRSAM